MFPFPTPLLSAGGGGTPFFSTSRGALVHMTSGTTSIGSSIAALSIYDQTDYDPLGYKQDNATLQVPSGSGISLIRVIGSQEVDAPGLATATRKWDGSAYSSFVGKGNSRPFRTSDALGIDCSAILPVSGGEKFQHWRETTGSANAINECNWFGIEVIPSGTRYTVATKSGTQSLGTTRTSVNWDTEVSDSLNSHSTVSNTHQFVIPSDTTGLVRVHAQIGASAALTGLMQAWVTLNGADVARAGITQTSATPFLPVFSPILAVSPGDIITIDIQFAASDGVAGVNDAAFVCVEELPSTHRYCLVQKSASQGISNTDSAIQWDGADIHDPEALHDPSSNNSRINVASGATEMRVTYWLVCSTNPKSWTYDGSIKVPGCPVDGNGSGTNNGMGTWVSCSGRSYLEIHAIVSTTANVTSGMFQVEFR